MPGSYIAKYTKIGSGYMGQLVGWPEVITEGSTPEECREILKDALHKMILAYRQRNREILVGQALLEQIAVDSKQLSVASPPPVFYRKTANLWSACRACLCR